MRLARDFTLQTALGYQIEKLFYMAISNSTHYDWFDLSLCFGNIEGAGSTVYWLHANRNLSEMLDNTSPSFTPIDPNQPYLDRAQIIRAITGFYHIQRYGSRRAIYFYKESTGKRIEEMFPDLYK